MKTLFLRVVHCISCTYVRFCDVRTYASICIPTFMPPYTDTHSHMRAREQERVRYDFIVRLFLGLPTYALT